MRLPTPARFTVVFASRTVRAACVWLSGALIVAVVALTGCFTFTAVDAPSAPASSSSYTVTVTLTPEDTSTESLRGVFAVHIPQEWELTSATYTGQLSGSLTHSAMISTWYEGYWPTADYGWDHAAKPGYKWWAGYSVAGQLGTTEPLTVTLTFDQHGATGTYLLDFSTGITDPDLPEDLDANADGEAWSLRELLDRPVFVGVPVENLPPRILYEEGLKPWVAVGEPFWALGYVFDPEADATVVSADYGDGTVDELALDGEFMGLGEWSWGLEHAWDRPGTYEVLIAASDGVNEATLPLTVRVGQSPFPDVDPAHEFFPAILALWRHDVIGGYNDGTFRMHQPVLRAQLAKMVAGAFFYHDEEITNEDAPTFRDVVYDGQAYPFDFIEEGAANGLIAGFADDTFRPWSPLTRIQLVRIIVRAAGWLETPPPGYKMPFGDLDPLDRGVVAKAHYNGLISGKTATSFAPYQQATRGHVAKVLHNALDIEDTELFSAAVPSDEKQLESWSAR